LLNNNSPYIKTSSDLALLEDRRFREYVELFSQDKEQFFEVYKTAHQKLSEFGCSGLLSEVVGGVEEEKLSLI